MSRSAELEEPRVRKSPSPLLPRRQRHFEDRRRRRLRHEVVGLGLMTLGLLIFLSAVPQAGFVAPAIRATLSFLVGRVGASLVALGFVLAGMALLVRHQGVGAGRATAGVALLFWIFLGLNQIGAPERGFIGRDFVHEPGGLLGVLLAEILRPCFGN